MLAAMPSDRRISKEDAGVLRVGITGAKCGNCRFWKSNETCDLVRGKLTFTMCCNGWSPKHGTQNDYRFASGEAFRPALASTEHGLDIRRE